ncbi:MAG: hypothetical protein WBM76_05910 [Woeseiaceae bacterium]|jgi:hypothetical protein
MQKTLSKGFLLLVLSACMPSAMALDPDECEARLKSVDDRIASGKYSAQNVQMAQQMRDSILQSCPYLDDATVDKMMEGFENLLPTRSEAERQAASDAKRAERAAQRDIERAELDVRRKERAEREQREAAVKPPLVSEVLTRPPTANSLGGEHVDRRDGMYYAKIYDWDLYQDKLRVLYVTNPSRDQYVRDRRQHFVYVIEADANGSVTQHDVTGEPTARVATAGLRRGYDEVILQHVVSGTAGEAGDIERWSISDQKKLSSVSAPSVQPFRLSTSDGNVLFVEHLSSDGKDSSVSWSKMSLGGKVLARGKLESDGSKVSASKWFNTPNGSGGLVINKLANTEEGVDSDLAPITRRVGTSEVTAVVGTEERLFVMGNGAIAAWESPAIARWFVWLGLSERSLSTILDEQVEMDRTVGEIEREHGGRIRLAGNDVVSLGDGYGVLVENDYRNKEQSPVHGTWLYEYAIDGDVRKTYLNPAAEHLEANFDFLAAPSRNSVFLFGRGSSSYVVQLDEDRGISAYGKAAISQRTIPAGIVAGNGGVWVLGTGKTDDELQKIWLERIDF